MGVSGVVSGGRLSKKITYKDLTCNHNSVAPVVYFGNNTNNVILLKLLRTYGCKENNDQDVGEYRDVDSVTIANNINIPPPDDDTFDFIYQPACLRLPNVGRYFKSLACDESGCLFSPTMQPRKTCLIVANVIKCINI